MMQNKLLGCLVMLLLLACNQSSPVPLTFGVVLKATPLRDLPEEYATILAYAEKQDTLRIGRMLQRRTETDEVQLWYVANLRDEVQGWVNAADLQLYSPAINVIVTKELPPSPSLPRHHIYFDADPNPLSEAGREVDKKFRKVFGNSQDRLLFRLQDAFQPDHPTVRNWAATLAGKNPGPLHLAQICNLFDGLKENFVYVSDPAAREYFVPSSVMLADIADTPSPGDCDDFALALASGLEAISGRTQLTLAINDQGGHAFGELFLGNSKLLPAVKSYLCARYQVEIIPGIRVDENGDCWLYFDNNGNHPGSSPFSYQKALRFDLNKGQYRLIQSGSSYLQ